MNSGKMTKMMTLLQDANTTNATWPEYVGCHKQFTFTGRTGVQKKQQMMLTPLDAFNQLVYEVVINLIVTETHIFT